MSASARNPDSESSSAFGLTEIWARGEKRTRLSRGAMLKQLGALAWRSAISAPLTALLTLATMSVALFLLAAFCLVLQTLNRLAVETRSDVALTIYLKAGDTGAQRSELEREITARAEVASTLFRSSEAALEEFGRSLGDDAALLEGLADTNPLPASFEVRFKPEFGSTEVYREFAARYEEHPLVEHIHYSGGVVGRLGAIVQGLRVGGGGAVLFMLVATGFLMANTIKLALYAHRSEIEIMRLVGATQSFVRAPFLIEGTAQGVIGAGLGLALLGGVVGIVNRFLARSESFSQVVRSIPGLELSGMALVLGAGIVVGLLGSFLAVRRFSIE